MPVPRPDATNLTPQQTRLIQLLPATSSDLADDLDCTQSTVRDHISDIKRHGFTITYDHTTNEYDLPYLTPPPEDAINIDENTSDTGTRMYAWSRAHQSLILDEAATIYYHNEKYSLKLSDHIIDTYFGDVSHVDLWYDKDAQQILLKPSESAENAYSIVEQSGVNIINCHQLLEYMDVGVEAPQTVHASWDDEADGLAVHIPTDPFDTVLPRPQHTPLNDHVEPA